MWRKPQFLITSCNSVFKTNINETTREKTSIWKPDKTKAPFFLLVSVDVKWLMKWMQVSKPQLSVSVLAYCECALDVPFT